MKNIFKNYKVLRILSLSIITFISLLNYHSAHAETHVFSNDLLHGGSWNKEGSPYILDESVYIPQGYSLHIDEGVTVISASTSDEYGFNPNSLTFDGDLIIWGTIAKPVNIIGLDSLYFNNSKIIEIKNAIFDNTGLYLKNSTSTISNSIIKNTDTAIDIKGSRISIDKSKLINNRIGIGSYKLFNTSHLMINNLNWLINTAHADELINIIDQSQNIIKINNSDIFNNSEYNILQQSINTIDARNNYWGSKEGPELNKIYGSIVYLPWLDKDIDDKNICCSNVLFLPGIEASRLYKDNTGISIKSTNMLWEPNRNDDVKKMYMDKNGKSIDSSIYTTDIIDSAFGLNSYSIYESFIAMMNSMVADNTINQWLPFPYDWRMNVEEIVNNKTKLATTSISMIEEVEKLAKNSKTGKVTIIAHSNGGLVAKELMKALESKNNDGIIDKVINIAVPELGTPQAILGLLHGNNQSILAGTILTENNARTFSQNMPGAYGLLPSRKFFENNPMNVISNLFSSSSNTTVSTYDVMKNFLLSNNFSKKSTTNTDIPLLLNSNIISIADSIHSVIDSFKPATSTKILSIFGWGIPTSKGIEYEKDPHCNQRLKDLVHSTCDNVYNSVIDNYGDGTVLTKANSNNADSTLFFDLKKVKENTKEEITHADILESTDLLAKVKDTIIEASSSNKSYEKYFSTAEPVDTDKYLTIKIYSPVDIDIYDKDGNHTGLLDSTTTDSRLKNYENDIPGSYYSNINGRKMIRIPYGEDYQILLKGNDTGTFIVKADISQSDKIISQISFGELPVTSNMNAEMIIATNTDMLATSSSIIIDENGDNITEYEQNTEEYLDRHQKEKGHRKEIRKKIINKYKKINNNIKNINKDKNKDGNKDGDRDKDKNK